MNISQKLSIPKFSANSSKKTKFLVFAIAFIILCSTFILSLTLGSTKIDILKILSSFNSINKSNPDFRILFYIRLPRAIAALLAGSALAVSGVLIQAVLNNAMAAPNIIGVNSGAGFFVVLTMALLPDSINLIPISAFFGAFISCMFIYLLAKKTGASRMSITLAGIAVSSILNSGISMVKTLSPNSVYNMSAFSIGGLGGVGFNSLKLPSVLIIISIFISLIISKDLDILNLGETTAKSLGMNTEKMRFIFLTLASILAGATVSFAGLVGFVGLVIPHIVRTFTGHRHRLLVPFSAMFGAEMMLICDIISRTMFVPYEIPVGILLSIIGGIFFIFLILTQRKPKVQ